MSGWTPERRAKMAALMQERKPWLKSTGPTTESGKKKVSRNGVKRQQEPAPQAAPEPKALPPDPEPKPAEQPVEQPGHGGFYSAPIQRPMLYHVMGKKRS
jgi:hypothetical protein